MLRQSLQSSIEDFYAAFSDVPAPTQIEGCPCCIDNKDVSVLLNTPLRKLTGSDLGSYSSSAFLTVGDVADYLYFLPRILEITTQDGGWWPSIEVTARAIRSAGLESWPTHRREVLEKLLLVALRSFVESKELERIDEWMCGIARLDLDVRPFLQIVESDPDAVLSYFEDNVDSLRNGLLRNPFWVLPNVGHDVIVEWFKSERISQIPFQAYGFTW